MFLTRFSINTTRRGSRHLLASQQRMHAAVLGCFPPAADPGRVLWRVDTERHRKELFIASVSRPDLSGLVEQAGWPALPEENWATADYQPFLDRLQAGQRWAFRLTANPVRSVPREHGERGRVSAHVTAARQEQWLLKRAPRLGFAIPPGGSGEPQVAVRDRRTARFERRSSSTGQQVTVVMATYDGLLEVTDAGALRKALSEGVGRAKAYGCGLLTLARP